MRYSLQGQFRRRNGLAKVVFQALWSIFVKRA
jgi:hypothetical protein